MKRSRDAAENDMEETQRSDQDSEIGGSVNTGNATAASSEVGSARSKLAMNNPPEGDSLDQGSDKDSDEEYLESTCDEANKAFDENITKGPRKFEYLDHTADVQLHAWGTTLNEALEQLIVSMFEYMTSLDTVDVNDSCSFVAETEGHDLFSLTYNLLDELLYIFSTSERVVKDCKILQLSDPDSTGSANWKVRVACKGECFDLTKHPQGTEIKAITYSNMQVNGLEDPKAEKIDIFVIVDI